MSLLKMFLKACAFSAVSVSSAAAEDAAAPAPAPVIPWLMSCSNQANLDVLTCEFSQSIVLAQGNQRLATFSIVKDMGQNDKTAFMLVPVGVAIKAGLVVNVDGVEVAKADFGSCTNQGCQAQAPVTKDWIKAMKTGKEMVLAVQSTDGSPVNLNFQLDGFSKMDAMLP